MRQVLVDDEPSVLFVEHEVVAPPRRRRRFLLIRHRAPPQGDAAELFGDLLVITEAEHEVVALGGAL